ncbi:hypothetical protein CR513_00099, partial [Mucuna pruriens]
MSQRYEVKRELNLTRVGFLFLRISRVGEIKVNVVLGYRGQTFHLAFGSYGIESRPGLSDGRPVSVPGGVLLLSGHIDLKVGEVDRLSSQVGAYHKPPSGVFQLDLGVDATWKQESQMRASYLEMFTIAYDQNVNPLPVDVTSSDIQSFQSSLRSQRSEKDRRHEIHGDEPKINPIEFIKGSKSIEEHFKEMEVTLIRAHEVESQETTTPNHKKGSAPSQGRKEENGEVESESSQEETSSSESDYSSEETPYEGDLLMCASELWQLTSMNTRS